MSTFKKCEVCGKSDCVLMGVKPSTIGTFTQQICQVCYNMFAESKIMADSIFDDKTPRNNITIYDPITDEYRDYVTNKHVSIHVTKDNLIFTTRGAFLDWFACIEAIEGGIKLHKNE